MRMLLVTDDPLLAAGVLAAADEARMRVTVVSHADDVDAAARTSGPDAAAFDAEESFAPVVRSAFAFAALYPHVRVGVLAERAADRRAGPLLLVDRRRSPRELLGEFERVYIGS